MDQPIIGIKEAIEEEEHQGILHRYAPKYTVLQPYSQAKYLPVKARAFIDLMRPFTMLASIIAGISIVALYSAYYQIQFDFKIAFLAGLVLALLQGAGQAMNQSLREEVDIDIANGKTYRPTVLGIISLTEGKIFSLALCAIAISMAFLINFRFGIDSALIGFFAIFYTAPPLRVKKRFLWNNIWQGISRGFMPWVAVWHIAGRETDVIPVALGFVTAIWLMGYQSCKDFTDIEGDKKFGIRTLPVVLGIEQTRYMMLWFGAVAFGSLIFWINKGWVPVKFIFLLILAIPSIWIFLDLKYDITKPTLIENSRAWGVMYGTLGLFYTLPAVIMWV